MPFKISEVIQPTISEDLVRPKDRTSVFKEVIPHKAEITKLCMEISFLRICLLNLGLLMFNKVQAEAFLTVGRFTRLLFLVPLSWILL